MMTEPPPTFGYDSINAVDAGVWPPLVFDVIDVLDERRNDLPTLCTGCNQAWLMGPEALAAGLCWRCRSCG